MGSAEYRRLTAFALVLWIATGVSFFVGHGDGLAVTWIVDLVALGVAGLKARIVFREFMEVRTSPFWLRAVCDGWIAIVTAVLMGFAVIK